MKAKKLNFKDLWTEIPLELERWKVDDMSKFLKMVDLSHLIEIFSFFF